MASRKILPGLFSFRSDFSIKTKIYLLFYTFEQFSFGKTNAFFTFLFFCIFAQGFSLKMQLVEQNTNKMTINSMFFDSKTLKTFILDRFLSENTIKPMLYQGISKALQKYLSGYHKGIKTRYYDKIVNNSPSNIFVQPSLQG